MIPTDRSVRGDHVLLQAALNGARSKGDHPAVPVTLEELRDDAVACVAAGAAAIHLHPRHRQGRESLDPALVDEVVATVRAGCGVPVGVTTGSWIEPDRQRRLAMIGAWTTPDYASVNLSEPDAPEMMAALLRAGVGIEAGISTTADAERLARTGLAGEVTRILIEPVDLAVAAAVAVVDDLHRTLDRLGFTAPRLQHGEGDTAWLLLADAGRRGIATRIGLEDTLAEPTGERTSGNAALVRSARALVTGG